MRISLRTLLAAGVALMFALFAAVWGQETAKESPAKKSNVLNGRWSNVDPAQASVQNSITRLDIHSNGERTFVRMWVKCKPTDCDLGEESVAVVDADKGDFVLTWRRESLGLTQKVRLLDNGLLSIESEARWSGSEGRSGEIYSALLARSPEFKPSTGTAWAPAAVQRAADSVAALLAEDAGGKQTTIGNGFFLQPELLATSYTVIRGRTKLFARLAVSNITYPVTETIQYDEEKDLAIVRVSGAKGWPLPPWRNMLVGGIDVFVLSISKGTEPAVSRGIISTTRQSGTESQVEITAPASATDVGSPVLNRRGEVIGLLTSVEEGTTLATRASELLALLARLPVRPASGDTRPVALPGWQKPNYTEKARNNKVSGTVVMRVLVGADGEVKQVEVIRGLPDGLNEEAVKSMRQMRFKPATKNGQPIEFWVTMEASFSTR
jgi:TonB family protein